MPKLFFRKKAAKRKEAKSGVKESLVPKAAFTAVPSTPPPGERRASPADHHGNHPASIPAVSVGTQSEWPVGVYSTVGREERQPDHLSEDNDSEGTEPGYSTIGAPHGASGRSKTLDSGLPTPSHRPRLASPPQEAEIPTLPDTSRSRLHDPSPSPPKHEPSVSPQDRRIGSASDLPSVTSGLSFHSDSSDNLALSQPPRATLDEVPGHKAMEQKREDLYSKVVKSKKGKSVTELPPKVPFTKGSESPHMKGELPSHSSKKHGVVEPATSAAPQKQRVPQSPSPPQGRRQKSMKKNTTEETLSRGSQQHHPNRQEHYHRQQQHPQARRLDAYEETDSLGKEAEEDEECSEEDYFPSVETSNSSTDAVESPVAPRKHDRSRHSSSYTPQRPPITPSKKSREATPRKGRRHLSGSAVGVHPARPPSPYYYYSDGGQVPHIPFIHPSDLRPVQPLNSYLFSELQPDGTLQYFTATHVNSPMSPSGHDNSFGLSDSPATVSPLPTDLNATWPHVPHTHVPSGATYTAGTLPQHYTSVPTYVGQSPQQVNAQLQSATLMSLQQQHFQQQHQANRSANATFQPSTVRGNGAQATSSLSFTPSPHTRSHGKNGQDLMTEAQPHHHTDLPHVVRSQAPVLSTHSESFSPPATDGLHDAPNPVTLATTRRRAEASEVATITASTKEKHEPSHQFVSNRTSRPTASPSPVEDTDGRGKHLDSASAARVFSEMLAMVEQREASSMAEADILETANPDLQGGNTPRQYHQDNLNASAELSPRHGSLPKQSTEPTDTGEGLINKPREHGTAASPKPRSKHHTSLSLRACDERILHEKEELIKTYQSEFSQLREETSRLAEENARLQAENEAMARDRVKWQELVEHVTSTTGENSSLLRQIQLHKEKAADMKKEHQATVAQLSGESSHWKKQHGSLQTELNALREEHSQLHEQYKHVMRRAARHQEVALEVHSLSERTAAEKRSQEAQVKVILREKNAFVTKIADAKAIIVQLEEQCTALHRANRKAQDKVAELEFELEEFRDKEMASQEQLTRAVIQAEKAAAERDTFARLAKSQQKTQEKANIQRARNEYTIGKLQKQVEGYRQQACDKLDKASLLLQERDREHRSHRRQCDSEIRHLRSLLQKKQRVLDSLSKMTKNVEDELDLVWRASNTPRSHHH